MPKVTKEFLREKLREQKHLLKKSTSDMTEGDLAEALRVAASLRVLIHEHGRGKPLLAQLNPNFLQLQIPDAESDPPEAPPEPGARAVVVLEVPVGINLSDAGAFLSPELPPPEALRASILGRWWFRPNALIIPGAGGFSRMEIVVGLADKEGGAHVDTEITRKYEQLINCGAYRMGTGKQIETINVSRLMVGQAGLEILRFLEQHFP